MINPPQNLTELLRSTNISDVGEVWTQPLHSIREGDTVADALATLSAKKILSAPVVDDDGEAYGAIDVNDLVAYCVEKLDPETCGAPLTMERILEFLSKPVLNIMDISHRNGWITIPAQKSVSKAKHFLGNAKIHRVYLTNPDDYMQPIGVLSQSKMLEFLWANRDLTQSKLNTTIGYVISRKPLDFGVVTVREKDRLMTAFRRIFDFRISGVAVVDDAGILKGNISASDLKFVDFSNPAAMFFNLRNPISSFLESPRVTIDADVVPTPEGIQLWFSREEMPHFAPVYVTKEDNLASAVQQCLNLGIHRVYVVDSFGRPEAVLSLSDIIRFLVE